MIGANIRARRKRRCWSQEHLAGAAGINARTFQRAEEGRGISPETVLAIAAALDVSASDLQRAPDAVSVGGAGSAAPTGVVTLVFTDIQGSTSLWKSRELRGANRSSRAWRPGVAKEPASEHSSLRRGRLKREQGGVAHEPKALNPATHTARSRAASTRFPRATGL